MFGALYMYISVHNIKKNQPQANDHHLAMVCHLMTTYIIKCDQEDTNIKGVAA